jgi:hypothetical protein
MSGELSEVWSTASVVSKRVDEVTGLTSTLLSGRSERAPRGLLLTPMQTYCVHSEWLMYIAPGNSVVAGSDTPLK